MKNLILSLSTVLLLSNYTLAQNQNDAYINAYIIIADTAQDYFELRSKMVELKEKLDIAIDTLGRGFDPSKKLICLPDDDPDEIYAGHYFPRRYTGESLSLEYLEAYTKNAHSKTIALVTGIYGNKKDAEQALKKAKIYAKKTFILNTDLYIGCIH